MALYFAYGSNADPDALATKCDFAPAQLPVANAGLSGHRLVLRRGGVEDLEADPARSVWGVLFDLTDQQLNTLLAWALGQVAGAVPANDSGVPGGVPKARSRPGAAPLDRRAVPVKSIVSVRLRTFDGQALPHAGQTILDGSDIEATVLRLEQPAPDIVPLTDDQIKAIIRASLRCDLPAMYIASLCDGGAAEPRLLVCDIKPGALDNTGVKVVRVYSKAEPFFAVYSTVLDSVQVQYADDALTAQRQRQSLSPLGSLRWRIYGLMEHRRGLRFFEWVRDRAPALSWLFPDRLNQRNEDVNVRVAAALAEALAGNCKAVDELQEVYDDLRDKRISAARLSYIAWASMVSMFGIALFLAVRHSHWPFDEGKQSLWLATASGVVGAFFSIAIAIRGRTVAITLARRDNQIDAILRVTVGAIAAGTLLLILQTNFLSDTGVGGPHFSVDTSWQVVALIGFAAGFTERLVPDLLARGNSGQPTSATK